MPSSNCSTARGTGNGHPKGPAIFKEQKKNPLIITNDFCHKQTHYISIIHPSVPRYKIAIYTINPSIYSIFIYSNILTFLGDYASVVSCDCLRHSTFCDEEGSPCFSPRSTIPASGYARPGVTLFEFFSNGRRVFLCTWLVRAIARM